jgi:uncharacterized cofD-like protein
VSAQATGPNVVAIGGGHGLAATLRAARRYAGRITAIVSVADDGGSSGRLRDALGIPAPGDLRKCLVALAPPDNAIAQAFEHRFDAGELDGHALGNLVIAALAETTGDFTEALRHAARITEAAGVVLPATSTPVTLKADAADGEVEGQVNVSSAGRIAHVSLVPPDAEPPPAVVAAIDTADQVVIGPGSLFTSVLAAVAVPAITEALARTGARKVYVANLRPQLPETAGYDIAAHVEALTAHGVEVDVVLYDDGAIPTGDIAGGLHSVKARLTGEGPGHDSARLATALSDLVG